MFFVFLNAACQDLLLTDLFGIFLLGISENRCNIVARKFNQIWSLAIESFNFKCVFSWFRGTYTKGARRSFFAVLC